MTQKALERRMFESFLELVPAFNARMSSGFTQPRPPRPDVEFRDKDGLSVGVELKAWINEKEMKHAKKRERIEARFREDIGSQPPNGRKYIGMVWLAAAGDRTPGKSAPGFRRELFDLIAKVDDQWGQGHDPRDKLVLGRGELMRYEMLEGFLASMTFWPKSRIAINPPFDWITFPQPIDWYDERTMLDPLREALSDLRDKYEARKEQLGLDRFVLLFHYDGRAYRYNSPIHGPHWNAESLARDAGWFQFAYDVLREEPSPWDEVWILDAIDARAYRAHPEPFEIHRHGAPAGVQRRQ